MTIDEAAIAAADECWSIPLTEWRHAIARHMTALVAERDRTIEGLQRSIDILTDSHYAVGKLLDAAGVSDGGSTVTRVQALAGISEGRRKVLLEKADELRTALIRVDNLESERDKAMKSLLDVIAQRDELLASGVILRAQLTEALDLLTVAGDQLEELQSNG